MTFAIVQNGYAIFGVGDTLQEAYRDAQEWTENMLPLAELPSTSNISGELYWARITDALAAQVRKRGGDIAWGELPNGTLCTLAEEAPATN